VQSQAPFTVFFNFVFGNKWHKMKAEDLECSQVVFQVVQAAVQSPAILRCGASNLVPFSLYPLQIEVVLLKIQKRGKKKRKEKKKGNLHTHCRARAVLFSGWLPRPV